MSSGHRPQTGACTSPVVYQAGPPPLADREPPPTMGPVAAYTWTSILSDPTSLRVLRETDLPLVSAYCEAAQVHADASACVADKGVLVLGATGPIPNPMLRVQRDAAATMRQLSDSLGLNPLARIRGNLMEAATGSIVVDIQKRLASLMDE